MVFGESVRGCIDHHEEEGKVPRDTGEEPRIVERSGSCSSLVTEYVREAWDGLKDRSEGGIEYAEENGQQGKIWDAEVARLALASVLVDTACLMTKDKVTEHDVRAVEYLEGKIKLVEGGFDTEKFWKELDTAKKNVGKLPLRDILRKDYKEWEEGPQKQRLGISSVVKPISFLLEKAGKEAGDDSNAREQFLDTVRKYARDRELSIYTIMASSVTPQGVFQRELLMLALDSQGKLAGQTFWKQSSDKLGLERWDGNLDDEDGTTPGGWRKVWWERKTENSRKQVAPLLRQAMQESQGQKPNV